MKESQQKDIKRNDNKSNNEYAYKNDFMNKIVRYSFQIIIVLSVVVYLQTIFFDFTYLDDNSIIDEIVSQIDSISKIGKSFTLSYGGNFYRPIQTVSFVIDYTIGNGGPLMFHIGNVIFHCLTCCTMLYLLRLMKYNKFNALIATAIFSVHPILTHSVAWIPSRGDIFFALFSILSIIFFIKYYEDKKWLYFILHSLSFFLSLMSKETALSLPFVCLAYLILIKKRNIFKAEIFYFYASWILLSIIWFYIRSLASMNEVDSRVIGLPQFITNLPVIPEYFSKFFLPIKISVLPTFKTFTTISGLAFILALIVLSYLKKDKRTNYIIFGSIWFLFLLLPVMVFRHPQSDMFYDYMDHRVYLPIVGVFIILLEIIPKKWITFNNKTGITVIMILLMLFSGLTYAQSRNYKSATKFWKNAISNDKSRSEFWFSLGFYYFKWKSNPQLAEKYLLQSVKLNPNSESAQTHLGLVCYELKDYDKAITYYKNAIMINPNAVEPKINLGAAYNLTGRYDESIAILKTAINSDRHGTTALMNIFDAYRLKKDLENSIQYAKILVQRGVKADFSSAYVNWGASLYRNKDYINAEKVTKVALDFNPNNAQAYCNLALFDLENSRYAEAESLLNKSIQCDPNLINAYMNFLTLYYDKLKDYPQAARYAKEIQKRGGTVEENKLKILSKYM